MSMGLRIPQQGSSFRDMATQAGAQGLSAFAHQRPDTKTEMNPPGKTAGGALMAGAGMATAGYTLAGGAAAAGAITGPVGATIGAGVGVLAYLMS